MKSGYTYIRVILDRSGSMASIGAATCNGYNSFVEAQKAIGGECTLELSQFASNSVDTYLGSIDRAENLVLMENYEPTGRSTALMDAIGGAIESLGKKFSAMDEADRPEKVIILILTDGLENSSVSYTKDKIKEMVTHQQEKYSWQFVFLGAEQDAVFEAAKLGISRDNAMSYGKTVRGVEMAFTSTAAKLGTFRSMGLMPSYTEEDRSVQKDEGAN